VTRIDTRDRRAPRSWAFTAINVAFLVTVAGVGLVGWWPVYQSRAFVIAGVSAVLLAMGIAALALRRRWSWWAIAGAVTAVFVTLGLPLAAPGALSGSASHLFDGWVELLASPVTGWKSLLTLPLPLGSYRATLGPVFLLVLALTTMALVAALRLRNAWHVAAPTILALPVLAMLFGSTVASNHADLLGIEWPAPREAVVGFLTALFLVGWYAWRASFGRREAIRSIQRATGVTGSAVGRARSTSRVMTALLMVVIAGTTMLAAAPALVDGRPREVLRSWVQPPIRLEDHLSPLTTYRGYFTDARYDQILFTITGDAAGERVRLATLTNYDGDTFRVSSDSAGDATAAFTRLPATAPRPDDATGTGVVSVAMGEYGDVWLPVVGDVASAQFQGVRADVLADTLFLHRVSGTAVVLAELGLAAGDAYRQTFFYGSETPELAALGTSPGTSTIDPAFVPESLSDWVSEQEVPPTGAGLQTLIDRLRARGYLSHGATRESVQTPPRWAQALHGYSFTPALSGHSVDRIDQMFTALLDKEAETTSQEDADLVAAAGDDEQFAVAAALMASELGFPSRVVVGARLTDSAAATATAGAAAVPACENGACRGRNITVWVEVQGRDGAWVAVDVTPQYANPLAPRVDQFRDPENATEVNPAEGESVLAPPTRRGQNNDNPGDPSAQDPTLGELSETWRAVAVGGLGLLALAAPFLAVILAKLARRAMRRRTRKARGAWDEYVDTAVDLGLPAPARSTPSELAALYGTARGGALAAEVDRAVFGHRGLSLVERDQLWVLADGERGELRKRRGLWGRMRARVSLRSMRRRALVRQTPAPIIRVERRSRSRSQW